MPRTDSITGSAAAFPGGPATIPCQLRGWSAVVQRGVFQPFIPAMQGLALAPMAVLPPTQPPHYPP